MGSKLKKWRKGIDSVDIYPSPPRLYASQFNITYMSHELTSLTIQVTNYESRAILFFCVHRMHFTSQFHITYMSHELTSLTIQTTNYKLRTIFFWFTLRLLAPRLPVPRHLGASCVCCFLHLQIQFVTHIRSHHSWVRDSCTCTSMSLGSDLRVPPLSSVHSSWLV